MAKIAIDAGHGLHTAGKRCMKKLDPKETREWVINARVASALSDYLKSAGHDVRRMDDTSGGADVPLSTRVERANKWAADYYISVHHNSGVGGTDGGGTEVYVHPNCSNKSNVAQTAIYKNVIKRGKLKGNRSDGTRNADFYVLRHTKMPAGLIECGFMDSKTDIKFILDPEWSKAVALGIAEGICSVFGGAIGKVSNGKPKTKPVKNLKPVEEDGIWGKDTTTESQKAMGTIVDGIVSNQRRNNKKHLPNISSNSWRFTTISMKGSSLIRAIQRLIGAKQDGIAGQEFAHKLQKFLKPLGFYPGLFTKKLDKKTVIGWQKYVNSKRD